MLEKELHRFWQQQLTILSESPVVMAQRLMLFSQPFWSLETAQEYQRMYWEKYLAAQQWTMAWTSFCLHAGQSLFWQLPSPRNYYHWVDATAKAANHALFPVSRRVHSNRLRLGRRQ